MSAIMVVRLIGTKYGNIVLDVPYTIPTKQHFIVHPSYRGEGFFLNFNPSETTISHGDYILSNRDGMMSSYRGHFIDDSCKRSFYLAKRFQRRRCSEIDKQETRVVYAGHVCLRIGTKCIIFIEYLPQMPHTM